MAGNETLRENTDVAAFIAAIPDERRRTDSARLFALMAEASGLEPAMCGSAIVGFGSYHYKYESGREGDSCVVGFSPRKAALTVYLMPLAYGFDQVAALRDRLGKHKVGKGCLYINKLSDIDETALKKLIHLAATRKHDRAQSSPTDKRGTDSHGA